MNDFTKEELEDLATWGDAYTEFGHSWVEKMHRPLIDKIERMIDNYCDHKNAGQDYSCSRCWDCGECW